MNEIDKIIDVALSEVGYLEKSSKAYWANPNIVYEKIAGAGKDNCTKYAKELDDLNLYNTKKNFYPWCKVFVDWCMVQSLGLKRAKELLLGFTAGCEQFWDWYKSKGQIYSTPQRGDLVIFGDCDHIGIVEKVRNDTIYTIEGNTSNDAILVTNGGTVANKTYYINSGYIKGYCRPRYKGETTSNTKPTQANYTFERFVKDIQIAEGQTGAWIDGIPGSRTLSLTPTISRYINNRNACVKPVQKYLYSLGYKEVGEADGIAGPKFEKAVKAYQKNNGCYVDGEITSQCKTWKSLLKLL